MNHSGTSRRGIQIFVPAAISKLVRCTGNSVSPVEAKALGRATFAHERAIARAA